MKAGVFMNTVDMNQYIDRLKLEKELKDLFISIKIVFILNMQILFIIFL